MELTPRQIQEKRFHDAFRGYNHEEVDIFLDEIADAFERLYRENQESVARLKQLEERLVEAEGTEDMLKRTLLAAQRTADEAVGEARAKAQETVEAAKAQAESIASQAEQNSREIETQARAEAEAANQRVEELRRFESEYRTRLRHMIREHLDELGREGTKAPPTPPATAPKQESESPTRPSVDESSDSRRLTGTPQPTPEPRPEDPATRDEPPRSGERRTGPPVEAVPQTPSDKRGEERAAPAEPATGPEEEPVFLDPDDDERSITELFWGDD